jgi:hypothetical protein
MGIMWVDKVNYSKALATTSQVEYLYALTGRDWRIFVLDTSENKLTKKRAFYIIKSINNTKYYGLPESFTLREIRKFYPDYKWKEISSEEEVIENFSKLKKEKTKEAKKMRERNLTKIKPPFRQKLKYLLQHGTGSSGCVYFIQEGENPYVKIGRTTDYSAISRKSSLNSGNFRDLRILFALDGASKAENFLHNYFSKYRIYREGGDKTEWFRIEGELKACIEEHTNK